ncbi:hypothetical protein WI77_20555 [Burkholderia ubonensis]|nr:hypothetical protein WI77_20555 [Burkholderia ubonensis]OJA55954.1 hypothetical protein BGV68_11725 [Burkholderia ubonensis]
MAVPRGAGKACGMASILRRIARAWPGNPAIGAESDKCSPKRAETGLESDETRAGRARRPRIGIYPV